MNIKNDKKSSGEPEMVIIKPLISSHKLNIQIEVVATAW